MGGGVGVGAGEGVGFGLGLGFAVAVGEGEGLSLLSSLASRALSVQMLLKRMFSTRTISTGKIKISFFFIFHASFSRKYQENYSMYFS